MHWYRNIFSHVPSTKVREIAAMLKAIHAGEDGDALVAVGLLFGLDFQTRRHTPISKKSIKPAAYCFTVASRVRGQSAEVHENFGSSGSVNPYFSRSAFASCLRPSASSASAVTRALSLVQTWFGPRTLS